jgi:pyridoxamine 5'-phosphate oxidase
MPGVTDPRDMRAPTGFHPDRALGTEDLDPDPIVQCASWLEAAEAAGVVLPNAMALATADASGDPSVRHVLLRGIDPRGFVFYTNFQSRKSRQLDENPRAAIVLFWRELDRQVSATGAVGIVDDDEADAYFASRPRDAQVGAWASRQSAVLSGRTELEASIEQIEARFAGADVPRPPFWGGFRLAPDAVEFWQGREHRLHDRFRYTRDDEIWRIERLFP